jgi:hypothetical protein
MAILELTNCWQMCTKGTNEIAELLGTTEGTIPWEGTLLHRLIITNSRGHTTNEPLFCDDEENAEKQNDFLKEGWRYWDAADDGAMSAAPTWKKDRPLFGSLYRFVAAEHRVPVALFGF